MNYIQYFICSAGWFALIIYSIIDFKQKKRIHREIKQLIDWSEHLMTKNELLATRYRQLSKVYETFKGVTNYRKQVAKLNQFKK